MREEYQLLLKVLAAFAVAGVLSFASTPVVKKFAYRVGAIDVPKDARRMHKVPIPRLGGLAIFLGFLFSVLVFAPLTREIQGILLGAVIIVVLGVLDDIMVLGAKLKFVVQICAAIMPVMHGVRIERFSNFNPFSDELYINLGWLSIPVTIIWIVGITNAVNLIDGLDGLAVGVSSIASFTLLAIGCWWATRRWPSSWRRWRAPASVSCPITSIPPPFSWGIRAPPSWGLSWPPSR